MTAIGILGKGSADAAILHLQARGDSDIDIERIVESIKAVAAVELPGIMSEWSDAIEAHMPESFLRHQMNVQCNHLAVLAIADYDKGRIGL